MEADSPDPLMSGVFRDPLDRVDPALRAAIAEEIAHGRAAARRRIRGRWHAALALACGTAVVGTVGLILYLSV